MQNKVLLELFAAAVVGSGSTLVLETMLYTASHSEGFFLHSELESSPPYGVDSILAISLSAVLLKGNQRKGWGLLVWGLSNLGGIWRGGFSTG